MSANLPPTLAESEIRQLLEAHWTELTQGAARRIARQVIWTQHFERATLVGVAALLFLAVQIGVELACLAELDSVRSSLATSVWQTLQRSNEEPEGGNAA